MRVSAGTRRANCLKRARIRAKRFLPFVRTPSRLFRRRRAKHAKKNKKKRLIRSSAPSDASRAPARHHYGLLCCNMSCIIRFNWVTSSTRCTTPPLTHRFLSKNKKIGGKMNGRWHRAATPPPPPLPPPPSPPPNICLKPGCRCLGANYAGLNSPRRQRRTRASRWAPASQGTDDVTSSWRGGARGIEGWLRCPGPLGWCPSRLASCG